MLLLQMKWIYISPTLQPNLQDNQQKTVNDITRSEATHESRLSMIFRGTECET